MLMRSLITATAPHAPRGHRLRRGARGFTLLELLISLAIIAGLVALTASSFTEVAQTRLMTASNKLAVTLRHCFGYSVSHGKYLRVVLDLDQERYWVESSDKPIFINAKKRLEGEDPNALTEEEREKIEEAKEEGRKIQERARFSADRLIPEVKLDNNVQLYSVYTTNQEDTFTTGKAYIHFFPSGFAEPALVVIGLGDNAEEDGAYSLSLAPLTGKVKQSIGIADPGRYFGEPEKVEEEGR